MKLHNNREEIPTAETRYRLPNYTENKRAFTSSHQSVSTEREMTGRLEQSETKCKVP